MKPLNYVRRCKNKTTNETHKTLHIADNDSTFCGKELNEMWYVESSAGLDLDDVTCTKCRKLLCSDCSCEELLQPCEACDNYPVQKNHRKK